MGIFFLSGPYSYVILFRNIQKYAYLPPPPTPFPWMEWGLAMELALANEMLTSMTSPKTQKGFVQLDMLSCASGTAWASLCPRRRLRQAVDQQPAPVCLPTPRRPKQAS